MAPIAIAECLPAGSSLKVVDPTPLEAISHGLTLPGIPVFDKLENKRQWMCVLLHTCKFLPKLTPNRTRKEHMAGVFRVFARLGYTEGMSGHISVVDPIRTDAMWMNPLGVRST